MWGCEKADSPFRLFMDDFRHFHHALIQSNLQEVSCYSSQSETTPTVLLGFKQLCLKNAPDMSSFAQLLFEQCVLVKEKKMGSWD